MILSNTGLQIYFLSLHKLQTMLTEDCFRESYQKRVIKTDSSSEMTAHEVKKIETNILLSARNLMNIGVYITCLLGFIVGYGYDYLYGDKHSYFGITTILYSLGSVFSAYASRLNVDPQLDFNFNISIYAEAFYFTSNTVLQALLIRVLGVDALLSFGLANFLSNALQVVSLLYLMRKHRQYSSNLALVPFHDNKTGQQVYLLPNSLKFGLSLAYNAFCNDFFDQTYFVFFASDADFLGEFSLIRGFGSIFIRFIYMPVNSVTYNLYGKMFLEALKQTDEDQSKRIIHKIVTIVEMVLTFYSSITCFMLCYGSYTADVYLRLLFGDKWVNDVVILSNFSDSAPGSSSSSLSYWAWALPVTSRDLRREYSTRLLYKSLTH